MKGYNYYKQEGTVTSFTTDEGDEFAYDESKVLGVGAQGKVLEGWNTKTNEKVAVKAMPVKHLILDEAGANKMKIIDEEIALLKSVGTHKNIAGCVAGSDVYRPGTTDYCQFKMLVMEIVRGKELAEHIAEKGPMPEPVALHVITQVLAGLQHMHERGLVHRDLKPQNILVTGDSVTMDSEVKLIDFGVAKNHEGNPFETLVGTLEIMPPEMAKAKISYLPDPTQRKTHVFNFKSPAEEFPGFGFTQLTPEGYGARLINVDPEGPAYQQGMRNDWILLKINDIDVEKMLFTANPDDSSHAKQPKITNTLMELSTDFTMTCLEMPAREFTPKVDMWGVGVVLYMCLTGQVPFKKELDIIEGDYDKSAIASASPEAQHLVSLLLDKDPEQRLSLYECIQHPWLSSQVMAFAR